MYNLTLRFSYSPNKQAFTGRYTSPTDYTSNSGALDYRAHLPRA
jgi:hypothetical protein